MCGIGVVVGGKCTVQCGDTTHYINQHSNEAILHNAHSKLAKRGPDSWNTLTQQHLTFMAAVLAIRGKQVVQQPLKNTHTGHILLYNTQ